MANMSYCRFENTLHDLADCVKALEGVVYEGKPISEREWKCAKRMKKWCKDFVEAMEDCSEKNIDIN